MIKLGRKRDFQKREVETLFVMVWDEAKDCRIPGTRDGTSFMKQSPKVLDQSGRVEVASRSCERLLDCLNTCSLLSLPVGVP